MTPDPARLTAIDVHTHVEQDGHDCFSPGPGG